MFQLRPRVIYPPGLHKIGGVKDDHIIKNEFAIRFQEWKVHDYDIVKPGQVLLTYHNTHHFLGSDDLHEVRSTVSGWVSHRLKSGHVWQGDIIDAHVGLIRIRDEASFPEVPEPEVQVNHGDLPSSPSDEEPWRRMEVAMLAVGGVLGLIVVIFAICYFWLQAPPPPKPPPPKPEIISVTTTETVTVNNGGISTTPTEQHYSHVVHVRHHHHGSHTH